MSKRTQKSLNNLKYGIANQFITLFLNFISRKIFIIILGTEYLGLNGIFTNILSVLSLSDLGISTALVYSYYQPLAIKDEKSLCSLIKFYRKIYNLIALVMALAGIAVIPFLRLTVKLQKDIPQLEVYYFLFLLNVVLSYLFIYKTSILTADQSGYIVTKYTMIITVIRIGLQCAVLLATHNFILYLLLQIIFTLITNIILSHKTDQLYPFINKASGDLSRTEKKLIYQNIKSMFIYKISAVFLSSVGNIVISVMLGTIWVGLYSNYSLITNQLIQIIATLFACVTASIGNLIILGTREKIYQIFRELQCLSFIVCGVACTCVFVLINDFILIWLGKEYVLSDFALIAICINLYLSCLLQPVWSFREAAGLYVKTKFAMLAAAVLNIIFSVIFGMLFGLAGIILAASAARLCTYFWYEPKLLFREYFGKKPAVYYLEITANTFLICLLCYFFRGITSPIHSNGWFKWILKAGICFAGSVASIILLYSKTEMFRLLKNHILSADIKLITMIQKHRMAKLKLIK